MLNELRFALRLLARTPGFTALAVFSLAAAIGVNSGIFAIVDAAFLRPFIAHRPEEVVNLFAARRGAERDFRQFSYAEFLALQQANQVLADVGAVEYTSVGVGMGETIRRSITFLVTDGYLRIHGTPPAQGRFFTAEESRAGAAIPVAVLSDSLWRRLGRRSDIVGSPLRINGRSFTVVGVMPRTFSGGNAVVGPELWLPLGVRDLVTAFTDARTTGQRLEDPRSFELNLVARLQPGLTPETAAVHLPALATRLDSVGADAVAGPRELVLQPLPRFSLNTEPTSEAGVGRFAVLLLALAGAVLLIACLNLANLMLARGTARAREFAVRAAVGATRWVLVRQLLIEGLALSLAGGALGLLVSVWANALLVESVGQLLSTLHFAIVLPLDPDLRIVAATFGFCTLATLLFALVPAWRVSQPDLTVSLKAQGDEAHGRRALTGFFAPRQLLVMAQLALALMLVVSAGLFLRAVVAARTVSPGFDPRGSLVAEVDYSLLDLDRTAMRQRIHALLDQAGRQPGARHAALATLLPFGALSDTRVLSAVGGATGPDGKPQFANGLFTAVAGDYFATLGIPLLRGRGFTSLEEDDPSARVVILDETMARRLFPSRDALGERVQFSTPEGDGSRPEFEVVGIVAAHRHDILAAEPPKRLFVPFARGFGGGAFLHVRLDRSDTATLAASVPGLRAALRRGDPNLPMLALRTLSDIVESNVGFWVVRLGAILFGVFGAIALILAVAGVYGVKSYAVARREREIGIRMAIGARPADVLRLFLGQGVRQMVLSLAAGLFLAVAVGRALSALLYRVSPFDPLVLAGAAGLLATAALLAAWIPARRATRVDPMVALRSE